MARALTCFTSLMVVLGIGLASGCSPAPGDPLAGLSHAEHRYCDEVRRAQFMWDEHYHKPESSRHEEIAERLRAARTNCAAHKEVLQLADISSNELFSGIWWPRDAWMFLSRDHDQVDQIGYFVSLDQCQLAQERLAQTELDVSPCQTVTLFINGVYARN